MKGFALSTVPPPSPPLSLSAKANRGGGNEQNLPQTLKNLFQFI